MIRYIVSHPIQYQVPLIRYLRNKIKISVAYRLNTSNKKYFDEGFNKKVLLDENLLTGYRYTFLNYLGPSKLSPIFPITTDFTKKIFLADTKIIWVHGIKNWYNLVIIILSSFYNKKVFVRDEFNNLTKRSGFNIFINKVFFYIFDNFIDCYLSIGEENARAYKSFGVDKNKIYTVPYTVNNKSFYIKKKKINKKLIILFTGKLIHRKGCDILLNAIKILNEDIIFKKNTQINIVGDGILIKKLIKFKKENNLINVKFKGFKNQKSIKEYYKNSHLFIIPSREENWGLAINEAMAAKNIIISSNKVGAVKDLVKNDLNGYTFKNGDYKDLSKKIYKIYKNKKKINEYGKESQRIISNWSYEECYNGLMKAIKSTLK